MKEDKLHNLRHTLAHLLAAAVLDIYPDTKLTIGPSIENGFYYDFDFGKEKISDENLPKIEKRMRRILTSWNSSSRRELSKAEAKKAYKGNSYKQELIDEIDEKGEKITFYKFGQFEDLCRGGHLENPAKEIDSKVFKLTHVAGAYWRGDAKNTMLTRIYAAAFENKKDLKEYLEMMEEAKKRDHRKLGKELDLFVFSDLVGSGLPLWTPNGTLIRDLLDDFVWELRKARGYQKVEIPHITKKELYIKSGHWEKFQEHLFKMKTREGHEFVIKPMNCPHHVQIFTRRAWSYRDMPQRYSNTTMCYRDEQTGELHGISRTRAFTQDDAHIFCRADQIKEEAGKIWDIVNELYEVFNFELKTTFSLHDPKEMDKYLGDEKTWQNAENSFRELIKERGVAVEEALGEAAFYGPKIDFMAKDSLGREWQVATIQLDMNMPDRFDLTYTNEKGKKERVTMLHAAIMGSIERFMSVLIEHLGGAFPLWLSPVQVKVISISEKQADYAEKLSIKLREKGFRVEIDNDNESLGKKIRQVKIEKIPYFLVIGEKEMESKMLKVESREGKVDVMELQKFEKKLEKEIREKKV